MVSIMDGVNRMTQLVGRNRMELLLFGLGTKQRFGINVFKVREVIHCPTLTRMPHSRPAVVGIANMRGQTITVVDMGAAIGCHVPVDPADGFVIVTEYNRMVQGFLVHGVDRIVNKNWEEIKPPPKGLSKQNFLTAVTEVDDELVEIIDVEKILSDLLNLSDVVSNEAREEDAPACQGKHVFVADDSLVALKQVTRVLDQLKMTYTTASNGREALDKLMTMAREKDGRITDHIQMVISDVEMPEMDGYTLTRLIKDDPGLKDLYVCLHTSLSGVFNQGMLEKTGADAFLAKFKPDELADQIKRTMENKATSAIAVT